MNPCKDCCCPWCGSNNREHDEYFTNLDVIMYNLEELKKNHEVWKDEEDKDYVWWETEYGGSCLYGIDCHPVFSDSPPCLLDERNIPYDNSRKREETCDECKALWLMEKYE